MGQEEVNEPHCHKSVASSDLLVILTGYKYHNINKPADWLWIDDHNLTFKEE